MKRFIETLKVFAIIVLVFWALKAWALKPVAPPEELMQESANVQLIHRGVCNWEDRQVLCMVGIDHATETYWLLVFNNEGVLTHVVNNKDNVETIRWVHPLLAA
jgi:hypothetical protein